MILSSGLLKSDGVVVVEHPARMTSPSSPTSLSTAKYGSVNFSIFTLAEDEEEGEAEE